jgi:hypothetical protein
MTLRQLLLWFMLLLALLGASQAQVVELKGGDSTMFDAGGGSVVLHFPNSTETIGVGIADGQLHFGVSSSFDWHQWHLTAGDDYLGLTVGTGLAVPLRGLTVERKWKKQTLTVFAGAAGQFYSFPYFSATSVGHFGAGIVYQRKLPRGLDFSTMGVVVGSQYTAIGALHYVWKGLDASGAAGLLQSQPFANGSIFYKPIKSLSFFAMRQDYFFNVQQTTPTGGGSSLVQEESTISSFGASTNLRGLSLNASALTGTSGTTQVSGQTFGAGVHPGRVTITASYYRAAHGGSVTSSFTEKLTRRWSVSEFLTYSQGQWSLNYGGSFTSNRLTASVGYLTYFVPYSPGVSPFQQTINVGVSWQLPHSTSVTLATNTLPNGAVRWSTYGNSFVQGPLQGGNGTGQVLVRSNQTILSAKFIVRGIVKDSSGLPVAGAAILVGKETAFTDSDGAFFVRFRKAKAVPIKVIPGDFVAPGNWHVISAPDTATPEPNDKATVVSIEVGQGG